MIAPMAESTEAKLTRKTFKRLFKKMYSEKKEIEKIVSFVAFEQEKFSWTFDSSICDR